MRLALNAPFTSPTFTSLAFSLIQEDNNNTTNTNITLMKAADNMAAYVLTVNYVFPDY